MNIGEINIQAQHLSRNLCSSMTRSAKKFNCQFSCQSQKANRQYHYPNVKHEEPTAISVSAVSAHFFQGHWKGIAGDVFSQSLSQRDPGCRHERTQEAAGKRAVMVQKKADDLLATAKETPSIGHGNSGITFLINHYRDDRSIAKSICLRCKLPDRPPFSL